MWGCTSRLPTTPNNPLNFKRFRFRDFIFDHEERQKTHRIVGDVQIV